MSHGAGEDQVDRTGLVRPFAAFVLVITVTCLVVALVVALFGGGSGGDQTARWVGVGILTAGGLFGIWLQVLIRRSELWKQAKARRRS
ncbi:hypothetical protein V5D56_02055 [Cellulosimicrobium sp. PMB13]|uniref:hypothetical protein n=1 Tax=Cellulosimicrobium sp. PMB13 TaxID=3120158 RepID=UPI003F4C1164